MATAKTSTKHWTSQNEIALDFIYGEIDSEAIVDIQDGSTIKAANISATANNTGTLAISIQSLSEGAASSENAIAVTNANISSQAKIARGANIQTSGNLSLNAVNTNSFSTSASAKSRGEGIAGIAATLFTATTDAQAVNEADLSGLNNLTIAAYDNTIKNVTKASSAAGGAEFYHKLSDPITDKAGGFLKNKVNTDSPKLDAKSGHTEGPKLAGAISFATTTHGATATIGDSAQIEAVNDVAVVAKTRDADLQNKAESLVESSAKGDEATIALSAAIAIADYRHNAEASVGDNSRITAKRLGVGSDISIPYGEKWGKLSEVSDIIDGLTTAVDIFSSPLFTGFAKSSEAAGEMGIAGSLSYLSVTNNSSAFLGKGASVTLLPGENSSWQTALPNKAIMSWQTPLAISANTDVAGVFAAGNISWFLNGAGGHDGAASAGGAYGQVNYLNTTKAYISAGAVIQQSGAAKDVAVTATTNELAVVLGPSSGRGGAYGLNGMFSLANINSTTEAFISDKATVKAKNLLLAANEDAILWSITGAFNKSEAAGVGASVAVNNVSTATRAFIGTDSEDDEATPLPQGKVEAEKAQVQAVTDGRIEAISVAAAMAGSNPPSNEPGFMDKMKDKLKSAFGKANDKTSEESKEPSQPPTEPKFGLAVSGSAALNLGSLMTEAYVEDAVLDFAGNDAALSVRALNDTHVSAVSGAAALAKANKESSKFSAGIAGTIAVNAVDKTTTALIVDSQVTGAEDVTVQALAAGQQLAVALGTAINLSANQDKAASAAGSISANLTANQVSAEVIDSTISGQTDGSDRVLDLAAYDRTRVGTGGGSLIAGGKAGAGAAISVTDLQNVTAARLSGSTVSDFDDVQVRGLNASLVGAGGGMAGFTTKQESMTFGGALVATSIAHETTAQITNGSQLTVSDDVTVLARDTQGVDELDEIINSTGRGQVLDQADYTVSELFADLPILGGSSIISVAGVAQASGSNVGASITWNEINNDFSAIVDQSSITTSGDVDVNAASSSQIIGLSVGAGLATGKFAGAASITINEIGNLLKGNNIRAEVTDSAITADKVTVKATDNSQIHSLAGQVSASINSASAGGALAHNFITNTVSSKIEDAEIISGGETAVEAANSSTIRTLALAGSASSSAALTASISSAHISNTTQASMKGATLIDGAGKTASVKINATDDSEIDSLAGGAAASANSAAVGGAIAINTITNTTKAGLEQSTLGVTGTVDVKATNDAVIRSLAAAVGVSSSAAVNGSAATSVITNSTEALVTGANFTKAARAVTVEASDESEIDSLAGSISLSAGSAAVGGAAAVNVITNTVRGKVTDSTVMTVDSLLVDADNDSIIRSASAAGGAASNAAVNGSITGSAIVNTTEALVENSALTITTGTATISAQDDSEIDALSGSASGSGSAAVGGAATASTIANTTQAKLSGGNANIGGALSVDATNSSVIRALSAAGGASGSAAVTGSATTSVLTNTTEADVSNLALTAQGKTAVTAKDQSEIDALAGSVALSGSAAVGGALAVSTIINTTHAQMSNVNYGTIGSLELNSSNDSIIRTATAAGTGSGSAAVSGSATTSIIKNTTAADLVNTTFGEAADSLAVAAKDNSKIQALAGNVGVSGTAAVGGAVVANVIANTASAKVTGGQYDVAGSSRVEGQNNSVIETLAASGAGSGVAAVTGSVATSHITNTTEANVSNATLTNSKNSVEVLATDASSIKTASGGAAAGSGGVGAATSVNRIANTTRAGVSGGSAEVGNLLVKSDSESTIESLAVGIGGGVYVGVAGSLAVNLINNDTESYISSGAKVNAQNNVGVVAETDDVVRNAAGAAGIGVAAAGVAASVAVNQIGGSTKAYISGSTTEVTAQAQNPTSRLTVAQGGLAEDVSLGDGLDLETYLRPDLDDLQKTESVTGVAVNASATHSVENVVMNVGGGLYAGVAGTSSTNVVAGETAAFIDGAKLNSSSEINVKASDHAYGHSFIGSLGAGAAGVGLGVDSVVFANNTRAYVRGTNPLQATGQLQIAAQSTQGASSLATSGAGGIVGVVGTGTIGVFTGTTEAYLQSAPVNVGSLAVNADHDSRLFVAGGGASAGAAAVAGTFTVGVDTSTTKAYVADTTVETTGEVAVSADNSSEIRNWSMSGAAAGAMGVAGSVLFSITNNTTQAYISNSTVAEAGRRADNVSVTAHDSVLSENRAGAVGVGIAGGGNAAAAAVVVVDNTTSAYIDQSSVYAQNDALVTALAERDLSTVAVSGGVGSGQGIGGTAAFTLLGAGLSCDGASELNKDGKGTLSKTESLTNGDRLNKDSNVETGDTIETKREDMVSTDDERTANIFDSAWTSVGNETEDTAVTGGISESELEAANSKSKVSVAERVNPAELHAQTAALVKNSTIAAGGDVQVTAAEKISARIDSGALAGGVGAGIGGAFGILDATTNVTAAVQGNSTLSADSGKVLIQAGAGKLEGTETAVNVNTYQGTAGTVSLGAAVSVANVTTNVTAEAGTGSIITSGNSAAAEGEEKLAVKATDGVDVSAQAYGASVGAVAAGLVTATANKDGQTQAMLGASQVNLASGLLHVSANRKAIVNADSVAGSGGIISGAGSVAVAVDSGAVSAGIGDDVDVKASKTSSAVKVEAQATPQVTADAKGIGVGVQAKAGVSSAVATAATEVSATVGKNSEITAKSLEVAAKVGQSGVTPSVEALAMASGGALLLGLNATAGVAENSSTVTSSIGSGSKVDALTTAVTAQADTKQVADTTAINGGLVAIGGNYAKAGSSTTITALVADNVNVSGDKLSVQATGTDDNYAHALAGSGGVISGSAAIAETSTGGSTTAAVGAGDATRRIFVRDFDLSSNHTTRFNAQTSSINAAILGASGAVAKNTVDYGVQSKVGSNAIIRTQDAKITADNQIIKDWPRAMFTLKNATTIWFLIM